MPAPLLLQSSWPTLHPVLLQAPPAPPATVPAWLAYIGLFSMIISLIGLGFGVYSLFRKESREDRQARETAQSAKFKKLEDAIGQFVDKDALDKRFGNLEEANRVYELAREVRDTRIHKLEVNDANHETRLAGFQQATEKLADGMHQRCQAIENQLSEVGRMREDMAGVKAELKHVVDGYNNINIKLDRLIERLGNK